MKKMNKMVVAAALGLICASAVVAETVACPAEGQTVVTRRVVTQPIVQQPAVIGERVVTTTTTRTMEPVGIPAVAVSGATLSGRREIISNNAVVFPSDGVRGRVVVTDGAGRTASRPVRGYVSSGDLTPAQQSIAFGGTAMGY